jgi:hypothetical protein
MLDTHINTHCANKESAINKNNEPKMIIITIDTALSIEIK